MSNYSLVEDTLPGRYEVAKSNSTTHVASATSHTDVKSWQIDMLVVVVGLPTLVFFVALGGAFALLGPGIIYMGILSMRKRACLGRQLLRIITGIALLCLSTVALLSAAQTDLWHVASSILCLLAGSGFITTVLLARRKS
jgi:hypothetical protein